MYMYVYIYVYVAVCHVLSKVDSLSIYIATVLRLGSELLIHNHYLRRRVRARVVCRVADYDVLSKVESLSLSPYIYVL